MCLKKQKKDCHFFSGNFYKGKVTLKQFVILVETLGRLLEWIKRNFDPKSIPKIRDEAQWCANHLKWRGENNLIIQGYRIEKKKDCRIELLYVCAVVHSVAFEIILWYILSDMEIE